MPNNNGFPFSNQISKWFLTPLHFTRTFIILLIFFFVSSCHQDPPSNISVPKAKSQIINFIDPSGTAIGAGWPNPPLEFYIAQMIWLENNGGGILSVVNTSLEIPNEIFVEVVPIENEPKAMDVGEIELRKISMRNDAIRQTNLLQKQKFISELDSIVINYDPKKAKKDLSFLNKNIYTGLKKIREPAFGNYSRYAFFYTDFVDEPGGNIIQAVDSALISEINNCGADISFCTLLDKSVENEAIRKLKGHHLSSFNDFIIHLNSITTKN